MKNMEHLSKETLFNIFRYGSEAQLIRILKYNPKQLTIDHLVVCYHKSLKLQNIVINHALWKKYCNH